ncbi:8394_t:CDS:2 [Entrophospora sp. SA101]|nr:11606_t:CDS:2 [Entrophospora sp. SA101]CAJ0758374.1 8394_t:CDS:2 [Entrophospora sp. SA101]CAJ0847435.1 17794_t:CDS:2 [Entrophospora sp. SA101]CAJ0877411.1 6033_t:CDS:2 [Entrophospora sp. SA101]
MFPPLSKYQTSKLTYTPAFQRARKPFIVRNILTGIILVGFVGAVYSYTMFAIKQDDFSDVPIPTPPSSSSLIEENKSNNKNLKD